ncbi:hypothetical protein IAU60_003622 [Kwoniella sp. DSM 27419]
MSALGGRTKKVTTYGRKKTQIISVHSDLGSGVPASPVPVRPKRPVLQSKLSTEVGNVPATPTTAKGDDKDKSQKAKQADTPLSSPEVVIKAYKVSRARKVILSPACSPVKSQTKPKAASRKQVMDGVVIPSRSARRRVGLSDITSKFQEFTIRDEEDQINAPTATPVVPVTVDRLLESCSSQPIVGFSHFLTSGQLPPYNSLTKVGEASYSEVYGLASSSAGEFTSVQHVLKVIPLLDERVAKTAGVSLPDTSKIEDVKREIEVTKRMGKTPGGGFVEFIGAYIVDGGYPEVLLDEWDEYKATLGSSSVRPSAFPATQKYCLLVLSNAGQDLETYKFPSATGWIQAAGLFWQITSALARAEEWTRFEHRDLHEGQILITPHTGTSEPTGEEGYLKPDVTGIQTTVIDFGLSRLNMPCSGSENSDAVWTELPDEVFEGRGAQWDLYRAMKARVEASQGQWKDFHPITNVMWLQYVLGYTMNKLRLPKAPTRRSSRLTAIYERQERAWAVLTQVKKALAFALADDATEAGRGGRRGLRCTADVPDTRFTSAGDVLAWGRKEGWIR